MEHRLPGNLNISFAYVEGEALMMALKDVAVSSGSACTSASLEPSYVLRALGVGEELAHTSIRFGLGRFNTEEEVDFVDQDVVGRRSTSCASCRRSTRWRRQGIDLEEHSMGGALRPSALTCGKRNKVMAYSEKVIEHYENPRNVGSFDKNDPNVGPASSARPPAAT